MKFIALLILSSSLFSTAFAQTEANVIASLRTGGGFVPAGTGSRIELFDDGTVIAQRSVFQEPDKESIVAHIAPEPLAALLQRIAAMENNKLVDTTPDAPFCMDAPVTTYAVYSEDQEILIYQRSGCHEFKPESYSSYKNMLINLLDGLRLLHQF